VFEPEDFRVCGGTEDEKKECCQAAGNGGSHTVIIGKKCGKTVLLPKLLKKISSLIVTNSVCWPLVGV